MTKIQKLQEVDRHLNHLPESINRIRNAESSPDLRSGWEEFLFGYGRAIGKMITLALDCPETRSWGHRLKAASTQEDPGLVYLREARNIAEHGLAPFAEFTPARTLLAGGMICIEGSSSIEMRGNTVNGLSDGDYTVITKEGRPVQVIGQPRLGIGYTPFRMKLIPLTNLEKRKTFPLPLHLGGNPVEPGSPIELAEAALVFLSDQRVTLARLLKP